jgi:hypothetical protein
MAYNANPNNDVQSDLNPDGTKKVKDAAAPSFTGGVGVSDPGNTGAPGASGAAPSTSAAPAASGQFVNVQKYLNANQGAGNQIGQSLTNTMGQQTQQFGTNVSTDAQGIQNQVNSEKQRLAQASGFQQQVGQNAAQITQDPTKLAAFQQMYAGKTSAPELQQQAQQNADAEQSTLNDIQGMSNLSGSEAGRFQLLKKSLGRPTYTQGQQNLDQLLLQSEDHGQALNKFQNNINQNVAGAQNQFNTAQQGVNQGVGEVGTLGSQAQKNLQGAVGTLSNGGTGALGNINKAINDKLLSTQSTAHDQYQGFVDRLNNKQLTSDDLQYLQKGIGAQGFDEETEIAGATPADLAKAYSEQKYSLSNAMSPEQLAQYKALQTLSGRADSEVIGGLDESQVGQAGGPSINIDPSKLSGVNQNLKDLSSGSNTYRDILAQSQLRNQQLGGGIDKLTAQIAAAQNPDAMGTNFGGANSAQNVYNALNAMASDKNLANQTGVQAKLKSLMGSIKGNSGYRDEFGELHPGEDTYNLTDEYNDDAGNHGGIGSGKFDFKDYLGYNANEKTIGNTQKIIDSMNKDKGAMNIQDLMSADAKAKFAAANPTRLQELQGGPETNRWNEQQYNAEVNKAFGTPTAQAAAGGKTLAEILGKGYGDYLSTSIGGIGGLLSGAGNALGNVFHGWSDENLKTNVKSGSGDVRNFLDNLKPYSYDYKNQKHGKGKHTSIMAQDLEKSPEGAQAVEDHPEGKAVNYAKLAGMMLASQADLHQRIKKMENKKNGRK